MSRTEPEMPSIRTPLAHENALTKTANVEAARPSQTRQLAPEPEADHNPSRCSTPTRPADGNRAHQTD